MNDAVTIGMAATAVGTVLWFLVKMMNNDFKRSVSGVGSKLDSTIARFDERSPSWRTSRRRTSRRYRRS